MAQLDFQPPFSECDWAHIPLYLLLIIFFPVFMWQQRKRILFSFSNLASSNSLLNPIQNTAWSEEVFISPALTLALPVRGENSPEPRGCLVSHCPRFMPRKKLCHDHSGVTRIFRIPWGLPQCKIQKRDEINPWGRQLSWPWQSVYWKMWCLGGCPKGGICLLA